MHSDAGSPPSCSAAIASSRSPGCRLRLTLERGTVLRPIGSRPSSRVMVVHLLNVLRVGRAHLPGDDIRSQSDALVQIGRRSLLG